MSPALMLSIVSLFTLGIAVWAGGDAQAQGVCRHERHATLPIAIGGDGCRRPQRPCISVAKVASRVHTAAAANAAPAYGDTETQTMSALSKIERTLARWGYAVGDIVKLTVFLVGVPDKQGRLDLEGLRGRTSAFSGPPSSLICRHDRR